MPGGELRLGWRARAHATDAGRWEPLGGPTAATAWRSVGRILLIIGALAVMAFAQPPGARADTGTSVAGLETDGSSSPLGIDDATPQFSWRIQDGSARGVMQATYQIVVSSTEAKAAAGQGDIWDSGVQTSSSLSATYGGPQLSSTTRYYWAVSVTVNGGGTATSQPAWFETAYLFPAGETAFNALGVGQPTSNCTTTSCYECQTGQICGAPAWQSTGAQWIEGPPRFEGIDTSAQALADDSCCIQVNTTLAAAAPVGSTTLYVPSIADFAVGQKLTLDTGASQETPTVTSVGTAQAPNTSLAVPAEAGDSTISVASVNGYAVGAPLTIDTGASQETGTITSVGTAAGPPTSLFSAANAGDTNVKVYSVSGITAGQQIGIDSGADYERPTVQTVGTAAVATSLFSSANAGDTTIHLGTVTGLAPGNVLTIDTGAAQESDTIASVGTAATTATLSAATAVGATMFTTTSTNSFQAGDTVTIDTGANQETGTIESVAPASRRNPTTTVTLAAPLTIAHAAGASVTDAGTGVVLTTALANAHSAGAPATYPGTGVTLASGLKMAHAAGAVAIGLGTGISFTPALANAHAAGATVASLGTGIGISPATTVAHASGASVVGPVPLDYCRNSVGGMPAGNCQAIRPAPMFRDAFSVDPSSEHGRVVSARVYSAGLAYNNMTLNGTPTSGNPRTGIGQRYLDPGWTNYNDTVWYTTQDVTKLLQQKAFSSATNVIATQLGSGQFDEAGTSGDWHWESAEWRNQPMLIANLVITYADGTKQSVVTNNSWTVSTAGPNRFDNYYDGETYDARKAIPNWNTASFNSSDAGWSTFAPATPVVGPSGVLRAELTPPTEELASYPASTFVRSGGPLGTSSGTTGISGIGIPTALPNNAVTKTNPTTNPNGTVTYSPYFVPESGVEVYDTGQDRAGWATLSVYNCPAGTPIQILYGEKWNTGPSPAAGTINNSGFTEAGQLQTDIYVCDGTGTPQHPEVWHPQFSIKGFQFIQVSSPSNPASQSGGTPQPLPPGVNATITQMDQIGMTNAQVGTFSSSNPVLNLVSKGAQNTVHNCDWGGTTCDTPIYEKDPWTGDEELSAPTESDYYNTEQEYAADEQQMEDNAVKTTGIPNPGDGKGEVTLLAPTDAFYGHVGQTFKSSSNGGATPIWDAYWFVVPWEAYERYGDIRSLEQVYPLMKNYLLDWIPQWTGAAPPTASNGTGDNDGLSYTLSSGLGDWDPATGANGNAAAGTNFSAPTDIESSNTAYYAYMDEIAEQAAEVLGDTSDAATFASIAGKIAADYNTAFWDPSDGFYREAGAPFGGPDAGVQNSNYQNNTALSQTDQALALAFGLVPSGEITPVQQKLINDVVNTRSCHEEVGIAGARWILPALSEAAAQGVAGAANAALCIADSTTYPSYGFMLEPVADGGMGWTTIGEYWEASARSRDHHMFATIGQWLFENLAGIQSAGPAYGTVDFEPTVPAGLNRVSASIQTVRGKVAAGWHRTPLNGVDYTYTVPPDTTANVFIPGNDPSEIRETGSGSTVCAGSAPDVTYDGVVGDTVEYTIGSGSYSFVQGTTDVCPAASKKKSPSAATVLTASAVRLIDGDDNTRG